MVDHRLIEWTDLFSAPGSAESVPPKRFRLLTRAGQTLLALPDDAKLARTALDLYPAQTKMAKTAKAFLSFALQLRAPAPMKCAIIKVGESDAFSIYLKQCAGTSSFPSLAVLSGNPHAQGRRFVLMLFRDKSPVSIVKAGIGPDAMDIIDDEAHFLQSAAPRYKAIPALKSSFRSDRIHAISLEFVEGRCPKFGEADKLEPIFSSWIDGSRQLAIGDIPSVRRLNLKLPSQPAWLRALCQSTCHPTVFHGDCAPWNIRIKENAWTLLDWERGEWAGVPGWDWFHFVIQYSVLVLRQPADRIEHRLNRFLNSEAFKRYAALAGISENARPLVLAYLLYAVEILRQTEGLSRFKALLDCLEKKWAAP